MTKRTKQQEKRIVDLLNQFEFFFDIHGFERTLVWKDKDEDDNAATVSISEDYSRITINIFPVFFTQKLEEQRKHLLHELIHTWFEPLSNVCDNLAGGKLETKEGRRVALERGVSRATNAVDSLLTGRMRYASLAYGAYSKSKKK